MKTLFKLSLETITKKNKNIELNLLKNLSNDDIISIFIPIDINIFFENLKEENFDNMIFKIYLYVHQYFYELEYFQKNYSKNIKISNNFKIMTNLFIKIFNILKLKLIKNDPPKKSETFIERKIRESSETHEERIKRKYHHMNAFLMNYLKLFFQLFFHDVKYSNKNIIKLFNKYDLIKYFTNIISLIKKYDYILFKTNEIMILPVLDHKNINMNYVSFYFDEFCEWQYNIKIPSNLENILNFIYINQKKNIILSILCKIKTEIIEFYEIEKNILLFARKNFEYDEKYLIIIKIFLSIVKYYFHHQFDKEIHNENWYKYFINIVNIFSWKHGYGAKSSNNLLSHMNERNTEKDKQFIHKTIISFNDHMTYYLNIYLSKDKNKIYDKKFLI